MNCTDCQRHLDTLRRYCDQTPASLHIIDVDDEKNLPLIFEYKIQGVPHTLCYNIRGEVLHSFFGVKTYEEFLESVNN